MIIGNKMNKRMSRAVRKITLKGNGSVMGRIIASMIENTTNMALNGIERVRDKYKKMMKPVKRNPLTSVSL
ncbi:MAG: hypothetical protein HWN65_24080 [Candidatus Helarchaeota archaeon]|nr:hypothetical protein [Candidatus Helarchaeota archaeon]